MAGAEAQVYQEIYEELGEVLREATDNLVARGLLDDGQVQILHLAGISSYPLLKAHLRAHGGVNGLDPVALSTIVDETERIVALRTAERNLQTTARNIGKREQRHTLNKNKKRIEELTAALMLRPDTTANAGQRAHWVMEMAACEQRVANIEQNN